MSLLEWFSRKPRRERRAEVVKVGRGERSRRREQLYGVVRDAMVQAGILSAGYKFKALALDTAGRRFVIMVDLAPAYAVDAARLQDIERMIAELALARLKVAVFAVYWRIAELVRPAGRTAEAGPGHAPRMASLRERVAHVQPGQAGGAGRSQPLLGPGAGLPEHRDFAVSGPGLLGGTEYGELR